MPGTYLWTVTVWKPLGPNKGISSTQFKFTSHTKTVEETFDLLYRAGFACVLKDCLGRVVAAGDFQVRLSQGGL
jgi:hypothetical protein